MKSLSKLKREYEQKLSMIFYHKSIDKCSSEESQTIRLAAEIKAYHDFILPTYPEKFSKYSIADFNGNIDPSKKVMTAEDALKAKMKISEFCWGITDPKELKYILSQDDKSSILLQKSKLDQRLEENHNVVIYSRNKNIVTDENNNIHVELDAKPKGRTLAASIIMKEAINLRSTEGHLSHDYGWVSFNSLKHCLTNKADKYEKIRSYTMCEWLVVDDIISEDLSDRAAAYLSSYLDSFFQDRLENDSCTILICKFDIESTNNLEQHFGITMAKMINSEKTFKICL